MIKDFIFEAMPANDHSKAEYDRIHVELNLHLKDASIREVSFEIAQLYNMETQRQVALTDLVKDDQERLIKLATYIARESYEHVYQEFENEYNAYLGEKQWETDNDR